MKADNAEVSVADCLTAALEAPVEVHAADAEGLVDPLGNAQGGGAGAARDLAGGWVMDWPIYNKNNQFVFQRKVY